MFFAKISDVDYELVKKLFAISVEKLCYDVQDKHKVDIGNDSVCKEMFDSL